MGLNIPGGYISMADENTTPAGDSGNNEGTPQGQAPQQQEVFSREYVEELRRENAKHRTSKNEAVQAARDEVKAEYEAKLAEKDTAYTELQNELGKAWIELEKVYVALEAKVPSEKVRAFAAILKGEDKESITESAESAKELFGGFDQNDPPYDPTQGSGGGKPLPLNGDPIMAALKAKIGF
ncbi:head scaffolding protein [Mycobacterium phage Kimona]|uniref:Scaffolding protein n=1 Tax=Mycobacterium phage Kimona TaxID=2024295 RepID=A0A249XU29_9CAUD|nr:head scaffolding protein [Mycobacterium phage Kimona]ASZ75447.1 scaffolding protein [Mycobacterium phage Kimona]